MAFFEETAKEYRPTKQGTAIFLNGPSSCGKSTVAKALQVELAKRHEEKFLFYSFDEFAHLLLNQQPNAPVLAELDTVEMWQQILYAFHLTFPKLLEAGCNIIVDQTFHGPFWSEQIIQNLLDLPVFFVGIHCPLEVLNQREAARGDREIGLTDYHFKETHRFGVYDFEIDSSTQDPEESARLIFEAFTNTPPSEYSGVAKTHQKILAAKAS